MLFKKLYYLFNKNYLKRKKTLLNVLLTFIQPENTLCDERDDQIIACKHSGSFNTEAPVEMDSNDWTDGGKHNKSLQVMLTEYCTAHKPWERKGNLLDFNNLKEIKKINLTFWEKKLKGYFFSLKLKHTQSQFSNTVTLKYYISLAKSTERLRKALNTFEMLFIHWRN